MTLTDADLCSDFVTGILFESLTVCSDFRNPKNLYNLLKLLAVRTGSRIDISKLASLAKLSRATVQNYIDFFENTYIIKTISVLSNSPDRQIVKAKKVYFCDNGLVNSLADLGSGTKFENAVFSQLFHFGELNYFALKTGNEIDFIVDKKVALEVKESPSETDLKNLERLSNKAKLNHFRLIGRNIIPNFSNYIWGGDIK